MSDQVQTDTEDDLFATHPENENSMEGITDDAEGFYENEDGVYQGIPEADYHGGHEASQRASNTVLGELMRSPAHAKAQMEGEYDPSSSQKFGTALHSAALTPDRFTSRFSMKGQCAGKTGSGDRCSYNGKHPVRSGDTVQWYCSTHLPDGAEEADVQVLSESKMEKIDRMTSSLEYHPAASQLLYDLEGASELTVLWTHDPTGVKCKSRIDRVGMHPDLGAIAIDLKTTRSAEPDITPGTFGYDAAKYGYYRQASFYLHALAAQGITCEHFLIVAIEKEEPHEVVASRVPHRDLEQGEHEFHNALRRFSECRESGDWPGYTDKIIDLELPAWIYD